MWREILGNYQVIGGWIPSLKREENAVSYTLDFLLH